MEQLLRRSCEIELPIREELTGCADVRSD